MLESDHQHGQRGARVNINEDADEEYVVVEDPSTLILVLWCATINEYLWRNSSTLHIFSSTTGHAYDGTPKSTTWATPYSGDAVQVIAAGGCAGKMYQDLLLFYK